MSVSLQEPIVPFVDEDEANRRVFDISSARAFDVTDGHPGDMRYA